MEPRRVAVSPSPGGDPDWLGALRAPWERLGAAVGGELGVPSIVVDGLAVAPGEVGLVDWCGPCAEALRVDPALAARCVLVRVGHPDAAYRLAELRVAGVLSEEAWLRWTGGQRGRGTGGFCGLFGYREAAERAGLPARPDPAEPACAFVPSPTWEELPGAIARYLRGV